MALDPLQKTTADVLAVRILLGQLIVRIAAGSEDAEAVMGVMRQGAMATADGAKFRDLPDNQLEEMRQHLRDSFDRFFAAMRIEKSEPPK